MHSLWIQKTEKTHSCFHIPNADSDIFSGQHLLYVMVTSKHVCLVPPDPHLLSDWDCAWEGNTSPHHGLINNALIYVVKRGFLWLPDAVWWGMWCEYMVTSLYKTSKSRCVCIVLPENIIDLRRNTVAQLCATSAPWTAPWIYLYTAQLDCWYFMVRAIDSNWHTHQSHKGSMSLADYTIQPLCYSTVCSLLWGDGWLRRGMQWVKNKSLQLDYVKKKVPIRPLIFVNNMDNFIEIWHLCLLHILI